MAKKYKIKPAVPKHLKKEGKEYFRLYCNYFIDRQYLTPELVPSIASLAFLEEARHLLEVSINTTGAGEDDMAEIGRLATQIRMLKTSLGIKVRANEFFKPEDKDAVKPAQPATIHSLSAKSF